MQRTVRSGLRRLAARLWPLTLVGLVLGAVIGLAFASSAGRSASASTLIRIEPVTGLDQILTGVSPSSDAGQAYLANQLAYLSSDGYQRAVAQSLPGVSSFKLTATQEGQSNVVGISATAADPDEAIKIVNGAVDLYRRQANDSARQRVTAAMTAIDNVMAGIRADFLAQVGGEASAVDSQGQSVQLEPLRSQRVSLQVALQRGADVEVIDPTYATGVVGAVSPALGAVGGGLIGGFLALAVGLWWRARSGLVVSADALERDIAPVLRPVVKLSSRSGSLTAEETALARALHSQLPSQGLGRTVVVGASPSSGAVAVGRLLQHASSEHGSVTTANADEFAGMPPAECMQALESLKVKLADSESAIVCGSSFATAPALTELVPSAARVVFVVRIGVDTASQVEAMRRSVVGLDVPTMAIATVAPAFGSTRSHGDHERGDRERADRERVDHERVDHERVDHERVDHERVDHERVDHEQGDHEQGAHEPVASPSTHGDEPLQT